MNEYDLTPVQKIGEFYFKRDDLFQPFGKGEVNGGKLRQCMMLVNNLKNVKHLITYCSIHSPQAPITAAVALNKGLKCEILYGGTTRDMLKKLSMPRLCLKYKANIHIAAKSGRHNVLYAKAKELAKLNNAFIIQYGINIINYRDVLLNAVANQVQNIPDNIDDFIMVCGSGITAAGVLIGFKRFNKHVKRVHLVATAPNRERFIHSTLDKYRADRDVIYHSLFDRKDFMYEKREYFLYKGIIFHPNYEAKMMKWFVNSDINSNKILLWITGAEPTKI